MTYDHDKPLAKQFDAQWLDPHDESPWRLIARELARRVDELKRAREWLGSCE